MATGDDVIPIRRYLPIYNNNITRYYNDEYEPPETNTIKYATTRRETYFLRGERARVQGENPRRRKTIRHVVR